MDTTKIAEIIQDCFGPAQDTKCTNLIDALADYFEAETRLCPALGCDTQVPVLSNVCLVCGSGFTPKFDRAEFLHIAKGN